MTQQVIAMGKPPLGIGGDTYNSAFDKCNDNFTELYAKNTGDVVHSNLTVYRDLAPYYKSGTNVGALVIHLPAEKWKSAALLRLRVMGHSFAANHSAWNIELGGQPAATKWANVSASIHGTCPAQTVSYGWSTDHPVIIIGTATTTWSYLTCMIERLQVSYASRDKWHTGIWMEIEPDISAYTNITTPAIYGHYRVQKAEQLFTSRNINGVAFNGTKDITVADSTKLPLKGGTLTGAVTFSNTTASDMRVGIVSPDSVQSQFQVANGLISGMLQASVGGNLGIYSDTHSKWVVKVDKGGTTQLHGNAETASTWKTARKINGVSFDGSKDVTAQIVAPSIIGSNAAFALDTKGYAPGTTGVRMYMDDIWFNVYSGLNKVNVLNINLDTNAVVINGTMKMGGNIALPTTASSWISGHKNAPLAIANATSTGSFFPWVQQKTYGGGSWVAGILGEDLYFTYATKADYDANKNNVTKPLVLGSSQITASVPIKASGGVDGNASTATKLATARQINGATFDGTKNISIDPVSNKLDNNALDTQRTPMFWHGAKSAMVDSSNWSGADFAGFVLGSDVDTTQFLCNAGSMKIRGSDAAPVSGVTTWTEWRDVLTSARDSSGNDRFAGVKYWDGTQRVKQYLDIGHGESGTVTRGISFYNGGAARGSLQTTTANKIELSVQNSSIFNIKQDFEVKGLPAFTARAWVSFNGTGTLEVLDSGNVSSVTDNGTGNYIVNFTTPMPHGNYVMSGTCREHDSTSGSGVDVTTAHATVANVFKTDSCNIAVRSGTKFYDAARVGVAFFC